jgi:membrane protease YdiL (CAAX protease family)
MNGDARQTPNVQHPTKANSSKFFLFTFSVSWILFGAAAWLARSSPESGLGNFSGAVLFVGVIAPALVAVGLTARAEGREGVRELLSRVLRFPTEARWYVFGAGYMATIKLTAAVLHRLATGSWPVFGQENIVIMVLATIVSTPVQAGEEIGWRGYALPRLANRLGLGGASAVLGVIWACWHLPFFFMPGTDTYGQSFPVYLVQVTAISVAMAWLYWRTKGSLFLVMLLHAAVNNTKDIVPSVLPGATDALSVHASLVGWLTVALLWICAVGFLIQMRTANRAEQT